MERIFILLFMAFSCQIIFAQGKINRLSSNGVHEPTQSQGNLQYKTPKNLSLATVNYNGAREYFTIDDWEAIPKSRQDLYKKIGVCIIENGHSFIIAGKDAAKGELSWWNHQDGLVPGLRCYATKETAIHDFDGRNNTLKLNAVNSPSSLAASRFQAFQGDNTNWYLPACGQLWIISQNVFAINRALNNFGLERFHLPPSYNSSTQMGVERYFDRSYSWGWGVNLSSTGVYKYGGCNNDYVRSIADL